MVQLLILILIRWIVMYPLDSNNQHLNNQGLVDSPFHLLNWDLVISAIHC